MDINTLKEDLLNTLNDIDKNKLSLMDLRLYVDILKAAFEIQTKSYADLICETMAGFKNVSTSPSMIGFGDKEDVAHGM